MKSTSDSMVNSAPPIVERRSFIWKAGAALSATLASAAATVTAGTPTRVADETRNSKEQIERLSNQLGILEDTNAIRRLHDAFSDALNKRHSEDIVNLFAEDAEVHFNGGIFVGKEHGVRRLYAEHFGRRFTERKDEPVHRFLLDQTQQQDTVAVAPDRQSAKARFHCLMQAEAAIASNSPLVEMARQQGQGIMQWWESGVYENSYVKDGDVWKIKQLRYRTLRRADPPLGASHTQPAEVPSFASTYPENPTGPDKLVAPGRYADTEPVPVHLPHPVTVDLQKA